MGRWDLRAQGVTLLSVDLTDQRCCAEVFGQMPDVTHVVYAAVNETPGLIQGWRDRAQMATNLAMLENLCEPLTAAKEKVREIFKELLEEGGKITN